MKNLIKFMTITCVIGMLANSGCKKDPTLPTLTTTPVTEVTATSAKSGGNITDDGGAEITDRGVVWSTSENPTTADGHTLDGSGTGSFTSSIVSLVNSTNYYVRAYASNSAGTAYGNQVTFTTSVVSTATVTTTRLSSVSLTSAVCGGSITSDGGSPVTASGVCWGTQPAPTVEGSSTADAPVNGTFVSNISDLAPGTVYYVRSYATNEKGTTYGNEFKFSTSITDVDGNIYRTTPIGNQLWMADNLKTTRFNNNTPIPYVPDSLTWMTLTGPAYSWYRNNAANKNPHGALYTWFTITPGNLCPQGWHVPTTTEFGILEQEAGVPADSLLAWGWRGIGAGTKLKDSIGWLAGHGTNTTGLSILPSGYRAWANSQYRGVGELTYFWTATDDSPNHKDSLAWYRRLDGNSAMIYRATTRKAGGKSIRCVKTL